MGTGAGTSLAALVLHFLLSASLQVRAGSRPTVPTVSPQFHRQCCARYREARRGPLYDADQVPSLP